MRGGHDSLRLLGILDLRKADVELHLELERTVLGRQQAHATVDRDIPDLGPLAPTDDADRALEARRIADREQLLGIGPLGLAAQLLGSLSWTSSSPSLVRPCPSVRPPVTVASAV